MPSDVSGEIGQGHYGLKTTAADLLSFVQAQCSLAHPDTALARAIEASLSAYYQVGPMRQGLGWESYDWPTPLDRLLEGNATRMAMVAQPAVALNPPVPTTRDALFNKSGSTNGFGAYVAFATRERLGVVMLANKNFPIPARVESAYKILVSASRLLAT